MNFLPCLQLKFHKGKEAEKSLTLEIPVKCGENKSCLFCIMSWNLPANKWSIKYIQQCVALLTWPFSSFPILLLLKRTILRTGVVWLFVGGVLWVFFSLFLIPFPSALFFLFYFFFHFPCCCAIFTYLTGMQLLREWQLLQYQYYGFEKHVHHLSLLWFLF